MIVYVLMNQNQHVVMEISIHENNVMMGIFFHEMDVVQYVLLKFVGIIF